MKNWFRYSLIGMLGVLLLASCYRDKGNYSYRDLNEISIDLPDVVSVQQGMVLEVSPKLSFALEENEEKLELRVGGFYSDLLGFRECRIIHGAELCRAD